MSERTVSPRVVIAGAVGVGLLVLVVALAVSGALSPGPGPTGPPASGVAGSLPPAATGGPSMTAGAGSPSTGPSPLASPNPSAATSIPIDRDLLDVLPVSVAGIPLVVDLTEEARAASGSPIVSDLSALAVALVIDTHANDAAVATVIRPRPGLFSSTLFATWRQWFDERTCALEGGVTQMTETSIAGHHTFISRCGGGRLIYHLHVGGGIAADDRIISMTSVGDRDFGRLIVEGLR